MQTFVELAVDSQIALHKSHQVLIRTDPLLDVQKILKSVFQAQDFFKAILVLRLEKLIFGLEYYQMVLQSIELSLELAVLGHKFIVR